MTEFTQLTPEELFTRTLRLFKIPHEDFVYKGNASSHEMPFKTYMNDLFNDLERAKDPVKREKLVQLVKLRDQYGLSILGYILLLGKHGGLQHLYYYVKIDKDIQSIISSSLNSELTFVLAYYSPDSKIKELIDHIKQIKQYVPSFDLSMENAKVIGYRMAKDAFNPAFKLPGDNLFRTFAIPDTFVPYIAPRSKQFTPPPPSHTLPPPPPPTSQYHPPPPTSQYPGHPPPSQYHGPPPPSHTLPPPPSYPPPSYPPLPSQYPPPPHFTRTGGTRKNHKRHKKQMRKHASKKSKHV